MISRIALIVAAAVAAFSLAGCSAVSPPPSSPPSTPATVAPTVTPTPTVTPLPEPTGAPVEFNVYFSYHEKMQPAPRTAPAGTKAVLRAAIEALFAGPRASEAKGGLFTSIPADTKLRTVAINANVAVIDLSGEFDDGGGTLSMTSRLAQVVFTATQFPGIDAVTFKINGKVVKVFSGEGIIVDKPQTRKSFEDSSPAILVENPAWRGEISSGEVIRGTANVFEAVFRLQVRDAAGKLVMDRTVQASSGTGTRGTWKVNASLKSVPAGVGSLRVFAQSAKDGSPIDVVNVPVIINP